MSDFIRVRIRVSGRVQGVYYRQSTALEAEKIGVTGWVRNLPNGDVEAVIEGGEDRVNRLIAWCRSGPPSARVDDMSIDSEPYVGEFKRFSISY